jgi:predicted nucleic acid-binding protein
VPVEAANILRRASLAGDVSDDMRGSVTAYDGWYVALAESLKAPLATLDGRLARAPGPRFSFLGPP